MSLPDGGALSWPVDRKLTLWLGSLAALAAFNAGLWIWIARSGGLRTPYVEAQLLLSGLYVGVCGFRSLFPRVDLERVCLWDTWLSAIRTLATGLRDSRQRRHPTLAWDVWRAEAPWMTVYFSIGVWTSLAMVLLERAASRS